MADATAEPPRKVALLIDLARLQDSIGGGPDAARALLQEALAVGADGGRVLDELERLAERSGSKEELLAVLDERARRLTARAGRAADRAAAATRASGWWRCGGGRRSWRASAATAKAPGAICRRRWRAAPGEPLIVRELSELAESLGRWDELADLLAGARRSGAGGAQDRAAARARRGAAARRQGRRGRRRRERGGARRAGAPRPVDRARADGAGGARLGEAGGALRGRGRARQLRRHADGQAGSAVGGDGARAGGGGLRSSRARGRGAQGARRRAQAGAALRARPSTRSSASTRAAASTPSTRRSLEAELAANPPPARAPSACSRRWRSAREALDDLPGAAQAARRLSSSIPTTCARACASTSSIARRRSCAEAAEDLAELAKLLPEERRVDALLERADLLEQRLERSARRGGGVSRGAVAQAGRSARHRGVRAAVAPARQGVGAARAAVAAGVGRAGGGAASRGAGVAGARAHRAGAAQARRDPRARARRLRQDAAQAYRDLLEKAPGHAAALRGLQRAYAALGDRSPSGPRRSPTRSRRSRTTARGEALLRLGELFEDTLEQARSRRRRLRARARARRQPARGARAAAHGGARARAGGAGRGHRAPRAARRSATAPARRRARCCIDERADLAHKAGDVDGGAGAHRRGARARSDARGCRGWRAARLSAQGGEAAALGDALEALAGAPAIAALQSALAAARRPSGAVVGLARDAHRGGGAAAPARGACADPVGHDGARGAVRARRRSRRARRARQAGRRARRRSSGTSSTARRWKRRGGSATRRKRWRARSRSIRTTSARSSWRAGWRAPAATTRPTPRRRRGWPPRCSRASARPASTARRPRPSSALGARREAAGAWRARPRSHAARRRRRHARARAARRALRRRQAARPARRALHASARSRARRRGSRRGSTSIARTLFFDGGDRDSAERDLRATLDLDPDEPEALRRLAELLAAQARRPRRGASSSSAASSRTRTIARAAAPRCSAGRAATSGRQDRRGGGAARGGDQAGAAPRRRARASRRSWRSCTCASASGSTPSRRCASLADLVDAGTERAAVEIRIATIYREGFSDPRAAVEALLARAAHRSAVDGGARQADAAGRRRPRAVDRARGEARARRRRRARAGHGDADGRAALSAADAAVGLARRRRLPAGVGAGRGARRRARAADPRGGGRSDQGAVVAVVGPHLARDGALGGARDLARRRRVDRGAVRPVAGVARRRQARAGQRQGHAAGLDPRRQDCAQLARLALRLRALRVAEVDDLRTDRATRWCAARPSPIGCRRRCASAWRGGSRCCATRSGRSISIDDDELALFFAACARVAELPMPPVLATLPPARVEERARALGKPLARKESKALQAIGARMATLPPPGEWRQAILEGAARAALAVGGDLVAAFGELGLTMAQGQAGAVADDVRRLGRLPRAPPRHGIEGLMAEESKGGGKGGGDELDDWAAAIDEWDANLALPSPTRRKRRQGGGGQARGAGRARRRARRGVAAGDEARASASARRRRPSACPSCAATHDPSQPIRRAGAARRCAAAGRGARRRSADAPLRRRDGAARRGGAGARHAARRRGQAAAAAAAAWTSRSAGSISTPRSGRSRGCTPRSRRLDARRRGRRVRSAPRRHGGDRRPWARAPKPAPPPPPIDAAADDDSMPSIDIASDPGFGAESTRVALAGEFDQLLADADDVEKDLPPAPPPSGVFKAPTLPEPGSKLQTPSGRFQTPSGRYQTPSGRFQTPRGPAQPPSADRRRRRPTISKSRWSSAPPSSRR